MTAKPGHRRFLRAFSLLELLVMIGVAAILMVLILPALNRPRGRAPRIQCVNNLKNLGLGYRIFSSENGDQFPWQMKAGGQSNIVEGDEIMHYLRRITKELSTPKILYCPSDKERRPVDSWSNFTRTNISYFISPDADEMVPQSLMAGDRNLASQGVQLAPGRVKIPLGNATNLAWTAGIHERQGNVLMGDGSVQQFSDARLRQYFRIWHATNSNGSATFFIP